MLEALLNNYWWTHWVSYLVFFALFFVLRRPLIARWPRLRVWLRTLGLIALIRWAALDNPFVYRAYSDLVRPEEGVDWFVNSLVTVRGYKAYFAPESTEFLAIGSSQSDAIYSVEQPGLRVLAYAGMQPAEYPFLERLVDNYEPKRILLYISLFDLNRSVYTTMIPSLPGRLNALGFAWSLFREFDPSHPLEIARCGVAWSLLEYQSQPLFKGIRDGALRALPARAWFAAMEKKSAPAAAKKATLNEDFIESHLSGLRVFIEQHSESQIIIAEGHSRPDVYEPRREQNVEMARRLQALAGEYPNAHFIARGRLYDFGMEDYGDPVHVTHEAGERFVQRLIEVIAQDPTIP